MLTRASNFTTYICFIIVLTPYHGFNFAYVISIIEDAITIINEYKK